MSRCARCSDSLHQNFVTRSRFKSLAILFVLIDFVDFNHSSLLKKKMNKRPGLIRTHDPQIAISNPPRTFHVSGISFLKIVFFLIQNCISFSLTLLNIYFFWIMLSFTNKKFSAELGLAFFQGIVSHLNKIRYINTVLDNKDEMSVSFISSGSTGPLWTLKLNVCSQSFVCQQYTFPNPK